MKKIKVMACVSLIFSSWIFKNMDTHSMPNKKVVVTSSRAAGTVPKISTTSSSLTESMNVTTSSLSTSSASTGRRNYMVAKYIRPGNILYRDTFDNGVKIEEGGRRPHVVIDVESTSNQKWMVLTIADTSRVKGREHKMIMGGNNYLLDPTRKGFDGDDIVFVKLNKAKVIYLKSESWQNVSTFKNISDLDLKIIRQRLGFD